MRARVKPKDSPEEGDAGSVEGGVVREVCGEGYGKDAGRGNRSSPNGVVPPTIAGSSGTA